MAKAVITFKLMPESVETDLEPIKEKALELFKQNVRDYPYSANAYDSISDAYNLMGNKEMAIASLEKALAIDPKFPPSIRKLREIKGE